MCSWWLTGALWLAFCLNFADRQVVFSIFPVLKSELGFTDAQLGLTSSMFLWVYALCSPVAGFFGDRVSKRLLVVASLLLWSAATLLTGLSNSVTWLLGCRVMIGVTESLFYPSAVALIAEIHGLATRSRALAFFNSGSVIGVVAGGWYGGFIAEYFNWRWAFYTLGAAGILYAAPFLRFVRLVPEPPKRSNHRTLSGIRNLVPFFGVPSYLVLCGAYSAFAFTVYLIYTWLASFLTEKFHLGLTDAAFTATAYLNAASVAGLIVGGWGADRLYGWTKASRFWMLIAAVLSAAPAVHMIGNAPALALTIAASAGFGFSTGLFISNLFASAFEVVDRSKRALAAGCLNLIGAFVSGFAGYLGGATKQAFGLERMMSLSALVCLLAGVALLAVVRFTFHRDRTKVQLPEEMLTV